MDGEMTAEIITVGNEILTGMTVNTNAAFIGERLTRIGCDVRWISTVGDEVSAISSALNTAMERASVVVVTGGLGPTNDDVTAEAVASFLESDLVFRPDVMEKIEAAFKRMNRPMAPSNRKQAFIPGGAEILDNRVGQAPGFVFSGRGRLCFVLPGVPSEMERMLLDSVIPRILKTEGRMEPACLVLRTIGIPESELFQKLEEMPARFPSIRLGFFPDATGVKVRLLVFGKSAAWCDEQIGQADRFVRERAGPWIYGTGEDTLESVLGDVLARSNRTLSVAESCTGGMICHKLTNVPGSSAYFLRGVVSYSNESKTDMLGVSPETLRIHGAVSPETAAAMAEGVRKLAGTDIGLSTTGISGPSGGTPRKPVGLLYIGYSDRAGTVTERHFFPYGRLWHKERSACAALDLARRKALEMSFSS
jgi:nicotinamide-nucleotide amidase